MSYFNKLDIDRMENKIINICKKGASGYVEYIKYIDDIISAGKYTILQELMVSRWNLDHRKFPTVESVKTNTYDLIRINYPSEELSNIKKIYDRYDVYQMGLDIFAEGVKIGEFHEYNVTESEDWYNDKVYMGKIKKLFVYLKVYDINYVEQLYTDKETTTEFKYEQGIKFLLGL